MKELLNNALEQLKQADIFIGKHKHRKQVSLFEVEDLPDIEFNGCKSLPIYQEKIYGPYNQCKAKADELLNNSLDHPDSIKRQFDLYCFEVQEFRQRYFPKDYAEVMFQRIQLHRSTPRELLQDDAIKKNS
jgi:hypothetical protein